MDVIYYGRQVRSSLVWLALALFLGGTPLIVYYTTPHPAPAQIVLAMVLGIPLFTMSLVDPGKSKVLILIPHARELKCVEGFFARRRTTAYSYDEAREVSLTSGVIYARKGAREDWWSLRLGFEGNREILLEETSFKEAARRTRYLGMVLGIKPLHDGEPLVVAMESTRPSTPRWAVLAYTLFYILGAVILALGILMAWLSCLQR